MSPAASTVDGRDVALLGGTVSDTATLELYDLACALVKYGARTLTIVIPYFGYSTMERAVKPGEVVTAKTRARLLSAIPSAGAGNVILLVDLHSEGIPHYFEGAARPAHVYAKPVVLAAIRKLGGDDFVIASTDAGRAKWVQSLAVELAVPAAFVLKRRVSGDKTEVVGTSADVAGKAVVIYDDMIRTGGSLIAAARVYHAAGARSVSAVATHGVFPDGALARIEASGLFHQIVTTDTHPRARAFAAAAAEAQSNFLVVASIAGVLAEHLKGSPWNLSR